MGDILSKILSRKTFLTGYNLNYNNIHHWIRYNYGKATKCQNKYCPKNLIKRFEWASISKEYKKDIKDYIQLCTSCHRSWDSNKIEIITTNG